MFKQILSYDALVYRLIEIRKGIDIPMGADRLYTATSVAREYARNNNDIAHAAAEFILEHAEDIISETSITPTGLGQIYSDLSRKSGEPYSDGRFPYKEMCQIFGFKP